MMFENSLNELFIVNGESAGWTDATRTGFILSVEDNVLEMRTKFGRDPFFYEVLQAVGELFDDYEYTYGKNSEAYERKYPYRIIWRKGRSGCRSYFIEIDKGDGYPERKRLINISCVDKCSGFRVFVPDFVCLLELLYPDGFQPDPELDIESVLPRDTSEESGWTEPDESPSKIADFYDISREKLSQYEPEAEDETEEAETGDEAEGTSESEVSEE